MPTPPNAHDAKSDSQTDLAAIQAEANNQFIDQAGYAISNATSQGLEQVVLTTFENCNIQNLQDYFVGLGYQVDYPDQLNPNLNPFNPAQLFGPDLNNYWSGSGQFPHLTNPVRMRIRWSLA